MTSSQAAALFDRPFADMRPFLEFVRAGGLRPGLILDVGANRGRWAEMAAEIFPESDLLLIEPQPELRPALEELRRRIPRVQWLEVAAGAREEVRWQTIWADLEGSSFLPEPDPARIATGEQRRVQVRRLDDLLAAAGGRRPELVKLDVQGYELEVLDGAPSLFGVVEVFVLEVSLFAFLPRLPLARQVMAYMAERGYELYDVAGYIRRPVDAALGQLDLAFVRSRGPFRAHDLW